MYRTCVTCDEFDPATECCYHHAKRIKDPVWGGKIWTQIRDARRMRQEGEITQQCGKYGRFWTPIRKKVTNPFEEKKKQ